MIVRYNDAEKPADRRPAVLERGIPDPKDQKKMKGRVLLLTTRMDIPPADEAWHDYWETEGNSWYGRVPLACSRGTWPATRPTRTSTSRPARR